MRPTAARARRGVVSRAPHTAHGTHSSGPRPASGRAVAFTPPTVSTVRANSAGQRHVGARTDRAVKPISHGSAAHGIRITEMRAA